MKDHGSRGFWADAFALRGSASPQILVRTAVFTLFSAVVTAIHVYEHNDIKLGIDVAPLEYAGAVLGVLLVLRTNAGYDRWWEGRKLWGGIVNQSRDLAIAAIAYGPPDPQWRASIVRLTAVFAHVARRSLRSERTLPEVSALLGDDQARLIAAAEHMPSYVSEAIAGQLRLALDHGEMVQLAFLQLDRSRATLIDHYGGCERILGTPLPLAYSIHIRRFIFLYLVTMPFALLNVVPYLTPLIMFLVAYPILALDQIGVELENPFSPRRMGHLPLDEITAKIEKNLLALLEQ
jgi:ion channel-forming bestrophin family protein